MRKIGLTLLVGAMVSVPYAAFSQETATPDDFVCAFTNDCPDAQATEDSDAPEAASNGGRVTATRSFSLSTSGNNNASTRRPTPRPRAGTPAARNTARNMARAPRVIAGQPGRVNLSIAFGVGSASLSPAAQAQARSFAQALQRPQLSSMRVSIEGHTDSSGSRASNVSLSQRRAQSVADYLVAQGVARNRVQVRGYGYDRPLPGLRASNPENRRVEAVRVS
jgi:outer membrane protein OmpA-like peptidoglycan-associated protein